MKIRCLIIAILITALNFVLSLCIETLWLKLLLNFCVIAIGMSLLYYWLVSPIREMKKQLKAVEEENRQLEAMRKEFVANVTHELKTPLTSITGFIETLQNGAAEDPEIRTKFIDIIAIEAARLKRLIEDTLVLSEIERKVEILSEQIQVKAAIDSIITVINPIAKENQVSLINEVPEDIYVRGNEDRFRQMMVNLIENAIKYSNPKGRVWIKAKLDQEGKLRICVQDEGIGISEDNLERLFERFYRVDKSRSRKVGGTGLGLSIVKHIAALFDAEVHVESKLGEGSTFYVKFK